MGTTLSTGQISLYDIRSALDAWGQSNLRSVSERPNFGPPIPVVDTERLNTGQYIDYRNHAQFSTTINFGFGASATYSDILVSLYPASVFWQERNRTKREISLNDYDVRQIVKIGKINANDHTGIWPAQYYAGNTSPFLEIYPSQISLDDFRGLIVGTYDWYNLQ